MRWDVGVSSTVALLFSGLLAALPCQSWRSSPNATTSPTKRRNALAPTLQAAPLRLALIASQIIRRQRVSPAAMAWDFLSPDLAIDIGEVDDRRTISRDQAPATN